MVAWAPPPLPCCVDAVCALFSSSSSSSLLTRFYCVSRTHGFVYFVTLPHVGVQVFWCCNGSMNPVSSG